MERMGPLPGASGFSLRVPGTDLSTRLGLSESRDGCFLLSCLLHGTLCMASTSRCSMERCWLVIC